MIGFESYIEKFSYDGITERAFPALRLQASSVQLKEANVSALKPLIEIHADKTVFNVDNSINSTGSTAYELLKKAPAVVVDNNDNITLKGRGGVMIQIDGRDMHLSQEELGDYLKSIQSNEVESIELISAPSSKYDAAGTAGIINIRLKKNKNYGVNATLSAGVAIGEFVKYNTSISVNYRSKRINLFTSYSNNWGKRQNEFYLYREQYPYIFDAASIFTRSGLNNNYKAGLDYTLNKKNTIGTMITGNYGDIIGINNSHNIITNFETGRPDSILVSDQTLSGYNNNINLNLNHRYADTLGHELTTDFDYGFYDGKRNTYQPNIYKLPDYTTLLSSSYNRYITVTKINIGTLKSDYSQNLFKGKLGAGYKLSLVKTDNNYDFFNIKGTNELLDNSRSNHFVYTENVYAAYLNYQFTLKKFEFSAGLRVEHTQSEGDLKNAADTLEDKNVKRKYTDYFPGGGITFNLNKNNSFTANYSRRIDRPNYQELNPFEFKLDELSYRKGNPFLNPQYSQKIEISHAYKYATITSIGYSRTTDFFAQLTDTISGGRSFITSRNLATEKIFNANVSSSVQVTKWYSLYFNLGIYNQKYNADFGNNKTINSSISYFSAYGQNTIKLPKDFTLEISGWYNTASVWAGAYVNDEQGSLDVGLQKKLFADQATLKISYSDVFNTAPWSSHNVYGGIVILAHGNWESQQLRATFTWRFGNRQMRNIKQRASGSESELKRISNE
jgi:hypothetical protein